MIGNELGSAGNSPEPPDESGALTIFMASCEGTCSLVDDATTSTTTTTTNMTALRNKADIECGAVVVVAAECSGNAGTAGRHGRETQVFWHACQDIGRQSEEPSKMTSTVFGSGGNQNLPDYTLLSSLSMTTRFLTHKVNTRVEC